MSKTPPKSVPDWRTFRLLRRGRWLGYIVALLCLVLIVTFQEKGVFPNLRLTLFDEYQKNFPRQRMSAPVTIVAIDEKALQQYGQWPWPRDLMAQLLANITNAGPVSMGFDVILAEADRMSADKMPWFKDAPPEFRQWLSQHGSNDTLLASVISQIPIAMGVGGLDEGLVNRRALLTPVQQYQGVNEQYLRQYVGELRSRPLLDDAAPGHGILSVDPDPDGIVRRIPMAALLGKRIAPSLDLEVLRLAVGDRWFSLAGDEKGISAVMVGGVRIPTQRDATLWIHYTPSDPTRYVSAADMLDGTFDPEMLQNKLVLVGVTGLGLVDYPATPVAPRMPGVEVRAQLLENIFDQKLLSRPDWTVRTEILLLLILATVFIYFMPRLSPKVSPLLWLSTIGGTLGAGNLAYINGLILVDVATPALGGSAVYFSMLAMVLIEKDRQNKIYERDLQIQREREAKMAGELEGAKRIQMGILPDPDMINDPRIDVYACLEPAKDVGGDLYDLFKVGDDHLFFLVGDVAGKGIPASLFMALGKSLYKSVVLRNQSDIATIMSQANAEIARDNPEMLFITVFAGLLNLKTGELNYCNAGHDAPHLFTRGNPSYDKLEGIGGPPLCILDELEYPGETVVLKNGQSILIITDGVTEAMNPKGELYSAERLDRYVETIATGTSAKEIVSGVFRDVKNHADGAEPSDDITLMAFTYNGPET